MQHFSWRAGIILLASLGLFNAAQSAAPSTQPAVDYDREIRPILAENCYLCHGPDQRKRRAKLRLDLKEEAFRKVIIPHDAGRSELIARISSADPEVHMPPAKSGKTLKPEQVELLRRWIQQGADWPIHWAFRKPVRPEIPQVSNPAWVKNPIDAFILQRLDAEGLKPSPEADRPTLIRRVTFDLTGLPPTLQEIEAFIADKSADAYEKVVDRLLASPHYGERMAQDWLDNARYADTNGYHIDNNRDLWKWRDWVIDAYNQNKRFDDFTVEQIAGDLLPNPTIAQRIATGFNRNEMVNFEGGAIEEEYATKYVVGRVATTAQAFLGLTMQCAECHDHKYDPITQKEFYQFYAFFNNVAEKGLDGQQQSPAPILKLPTPEQSAELERIQRQLTSLDAARRQMETSIAARQAEWEKQVKAGQVKPVEPPELISRFRLDEKEGASAADSAAKGRYGVLKEGKPAWTAGIIGNALRLDGKGGHIDCGYAGAFERTDAFSFGAWVNLDTPQGTIISRMDGTPNVRGFDLTVIGGRVYAHLIHKWEENSIRVITKSALPQGKWQHVFATYDGSGKAAGVKIYFNGVLQAVDADHDSLTGTIRTDTSLRIGRREQGFALQGLIDDARIYGKALTPDEVLDVIGEPMLAIASIAPDQRSDDQKRELARYFRERHVPELKRLTSQIASLRQSQTELDKAIPVTMVMEERKEIRPTYILVRGDYRNKGEEVQPGVPKVLPPLSMHNGKRADRLDLARWLIDPNHPLVSRVIVNRYWQRYFGVGIVKTSEDFGTRSEWPSHPELLDWLATQFISSGWDIKAMQRLIVTSATYRQASNISKPLLERDPENRLLARGPRFRLSAEEIRDNALAVSGLLYPKIGGPSVFPYQPAGLWEAGAFGGNFSSQTYVQSHGDDLYRRGIYTYWKRSMPYPSFTAFDAPNREICTVNRPRTNTPLQALVLLNDPVFVESARALAQRIIIEGGSDPSARITYAWRLCLSRPPQPNELQILMNLYNRQLDSYRKDTAAAQKLIAVGESKRDASLDPAEMAAWTAVANVLLNLDETITRS